VNFTAQFSFSKASAHLFDGSALKTVMDIERKESLKLTFPFRSML